MNSRTAWVLGIVLGGLFLCGFGVLMVIASAIRGDSEHSVSGSRVGIVEVTGTIMDSKRTLKELREFEDEPQVKAIVLRIDSPGGSVGPSQEIYDAVKRVNAKKKVIVSMGALAASGGFYIACAADKIFANPGTLTGSIGVIMHIPNVAGLMHWAGVDMTTLKAGALKDSGSPFRAMTDEEKKYFDSVLADTHQQFIGAVAEGRHMSVEQLRPIADGRVFTGKQARELKLVDALGSIEAAVAEAGKIGGIEGTPKVEYAHRPHKLLQQLFGGNDDDDAESFMAGSLRAVFGDMARVGVQYRLPIGEGLE